MRLIDSDKLIVEVVHSGNIVCLPHISLEQLNTAPVIKAIPIEWIKNVWLKRPENQGEIEFFPPVTFEVVMNWMIKEWEKENEK